MLKQQAPETGRVVCLSNVFDHQYERLRDEAVFPCLSSAKRRDLFRCLELATGRELVVVSSPPKARDRKYGRWLPRTETHFSSHRQFFCANWDAPKLRIPASWLSYATEVVKQTRSGDIVIIDNTEIIYILAAYAASLVRRLTCILEYEDGKHRIDRGWPRLLSGTAEFLSGALLRGALVAQPNLLSRLPKRIPTALVPGFLQSRAHPSVAPAADGSRRSTKMLYSGTLDEARGVDLLLQALPLLPAGGWELHITGAGPMEKDVIASMRDPRWSNRTHFHGVLSANDYTELSSECHVALNCQKCANPISDVTYPSKTFSYLSAGLGLISSRASGVPDVLGDAAWYYDEDTPASLGKTIDQVMQLRDLNPTATAMSRLEEQYSIAGTAERLKRFFARIDTDV